jgi:hypothetical protein
MEEMKKRVVANLVGFNWMAVQLTGWRTALPYVTLPALLPSNLALEKLSKVPE